MKMYFQRVERTDLVVEHSEHSVERTDYGTKWPNTGIPFNARAVTSRGADVIENDYTQ